MFNPTVDTLETRLPLAENSWRGVPAKPKLA